MDVIEGSCDADEAIQRTSIENLSVLTSGPLAIESRGASVFAAVQRVARIVARKVPVYSRRHAARLGGFRSLCGGSACGWCAVGREMGLSSRDEVAEAFNSLQEMDATVMGTVVNGLEERKRYGYGYRYGYGRARYGYGYRSYGYRSYLDAGPTVAAEKLSTNGNGTPRRAPDRHPDDEFAPIND